jgi:hypothetical protein
MEVVLERHLLSDLLLLLLLLQLPEQIEPCSGQPLTARSILQAKWEYVGVTYSSGDLRFTYNSGPAPAHIARAVNVRSTDNMTALEMFVLTY